MPSMMKYVNNYLNTQHHFERYLIFNKTLKSFNFIHFLSYQFEPNCCKID